MIRQLVDLSERQRAPGRLGKKPVVASRSHRRVCAGLLEEYEAFWTFCDVRDIEIPLTNNAAERALRHGVIMRRVQGGTQSEQGHHWVERILSLRETLRLQDRSALDYLISAATAGHRGQPAPSPLPAGP